MKLKYTGKTKDVYEMEDNKVLLKFKDDVTGVDGVFDPGANTVGLSIDGIGKSGLRLTTYFYEKINSMDIPTHFINSDIEEGTMLVHEAEMFGHGVEVICRYKAVGSFMRRYGLYANEGDDLDGYIEITLKDDERNDPLITKEGLKLLNIMTEAEHDEIIDLTKKISSLVKDELSKKDIELYDMKIEFGRIGEDKHIALIDEISGGSMRAFKDGKQLEPFELEKIMLS